MKRIQRVSKSNVCDENPIYSFQKGKKKGDSSHKTSCRTRAVLNLADLAKSVVSTLSPGLSCT